MMYIIRVIISVFLLFILSPLILILCILVKSTSTGPFLYKQTRLGKNKKPFMIYKIRTMVLNAEKLKSKFMYLNEVKGPVFKIKNDPRYTRIGKFLSHTGMDELPQLLNIIKGEMTFVGPRPLPSDEALKIPKKFDSRFSILPGIISTWVIQGGHRLSFKQWMALDIEYVGHKNIITDLVILARALVKIVNMFARELTIHEEK